MEKEELEAKFDAIQARVDQYNTKINTLTEDNNAKLVSVDGMVISENQKKQMQESIKSVPPAYMVNAKTLKDSMNLAIKFNLKQSIDNIDENEDIAINIEETVVMISISDKFLFKSGSYTISDNAYTVLEKIAKVINDQPKMEVMIEGHTDSTPIKKDLIQDNWDLSVLRATSITRTLQTRYSVKP